MNPDIKQKFKRSKIVFMDVDGVLTDGIAIFINGHSPKRWNVKDRMAVKLLTSLKEENIRVAWISGRPCRELAERGKELGVKEVHDDIENKVATMKDISEKYGIALKNSLYIGDDLVDLGCMSLVGISCCPADAVDEVKETADYIAGKPGGRGAVREILEELFKAKGYWADIVDSYKTT